MPRAQRDIRGISSRETQKSILDTCINKLEENPRPYGFERVLGTKKNTHLYRIYSEDRKFRIIYGIEDNLRAVIIVTIRLRNEGTYREIPIDSLSDKIRDITLELKETLPFIKDISGKLGVKWASKLDDSGLRLLDIAIKAIKDGRKSPSDIADKIKETLQLNENAEIIAEDILRLRQKM